MPAVVEADDLGTYVLKFRGAGQRPKAFIAEIVADEIARTLGLLVPKIVLVNLDPELARAGPDVEIQEVAEAGEGDGHLPDGRGSRADGCRRGGRCGRRLRVHPDRAEGSMLMVSASGTAVKL